MVDYLTIGEMFTLQRKRANLSQSALATLARVARNTIGNIEHDRFVNVGMWTLQKVAQAMDCALLVSVTPHADLNETELRRQRLVEQEARYGAIDLTAASAPAAESVE